MKDILQFLVVIGNVGLLIIGGVSSISLLVSPRVATWATSDVAALSFACAFIGLVSVLSLIYASNN